MISGPVKKGARTKELVRRLAKGDIALVDHADLDELAAEGLIKAGVSAVLDIQPVMTGRYPTPGPKRLMDRRITVLDSLGAAAWTIPDGTIVCLEGNVVSWPGGRLPGRLVDRLLLQSLTTAARIRLAGELDAFLANTLEYARREKDLLLANLDFSSVRTRLAGKQVLIVVRGASYRQDLAAVGPYLRESRPALIGVDGGADALLELGYRPDIIVGDLDSASDQALKCGAEIVLHTYLDGRAPHRPRLEALGVKYREIALPGTSEDLALLLAYEKGAELMVAVGTHSNLIDFLEKGRKGMGSTFLVRSKVGDRLVDARGVSRLYQGRLRPGHLLTLLAAAMFPVMLALFSSQVGRFIIRLLALRLRTGLGWR